MTSPARDVPLAPEWFDPLSQEFMHDPGPLVAKAREEAGPVFFSSVLDAYVITSYADARQALLDFTSFSSAGRMSAGQRVPPGVRDRVPDGGYLPELMILTDPPLHTATRKLANQGFRRPRIAELEEPIRASAHHLIDQVPGRRSCELMSSYCFPLTYRTLAMLLGLPAEDVPMLSQLALDVIALFHDDMDPLPDDELEATWKRWLDARDYLAGLVEARAANPGDDIISLYAQALGEPAAPTVQKVVTDLSGVIAAGADTTANTIAHGVMMLSRSPEQLRKLQADPSLWGGATEEILRMRGSLVGQPRTATVDVEVGGVTIPEGSAVLVYLAGASHDDTRFDAPHRLDVQRANAEDHLSFGKGRHLCLGAPLARVQARVALEALYQRLSDLHAPDQPFRYVPSIGVPSLIRLEVTWTRDEAMRKTSDEKVAAGE